MPGDKFKNPKKLKKGEKFTQGKNGGPVISKITWETIANERKSRRRGEKSAGNKAETAADFPKGAPPPTGGSARLT